MARLLKFVACHLLLLVLLGTLKVREERERERERD